MKKTPGVDMTVGSLGNGLGIGLGMAYYLKLLGKKSHVFVLLGDGEINEGTAWEAIMAAPAFKADNLIAIVDQNHLQSCGYCDEIMPMGSLAEKWKSFGWNVVELNGHDMHEIVNKLDIAVRYRGQPTVLVAHTLKGKGISFMEGENQWHHGELSQQLYSCAVAELEGAI
jgi:transketolase